MAILDWLLVAVVSGLLSSLLDDARHDVSSKPESNSSSPSAKQRICLCARMRGCPYETTVERAGRPGGGTVTGARRSDPNTHSRCPLPSRAAGRPARRDAAL